MKKFEARFYDPEYRVEVVDDAGTAAALVEAAGAGSLVKFYVSPAGQWFSLAAWIFAKPDWFSINIFSGSGERLNQELPH